MWHMQSLTPVKDGHVCCSHSYTQHQWCYLLVHGIVRCANTSPCLPIWQAVFPGCGHLCTTQCEGPINLIDTCKHTCRLIINGCHLLWLQYKSHCLFAINVYKPGMHSIVGFQKPFQSHFRIASAHAQFESLDQFRNHSTI